MAVWCDGVVASVLTEDVDVGSAGRTEFVAGRLRTDDTPGRERTDIVACPERSDGVLGRLVPAGRPEVLLTCVPST